MKGRRLLLGLALTALVALALAGAASAAKLDGADRGGRPLSTTLTGAAEVPGPGDPNGSGTATITVNPGRGEICYELGVEGITLPATGAHIHVGPVGESGDVVVPLMTPGDNGTSSGCAEVSRELALAIIQNPENYYVNVHNDDFPAGAIRGQL
ncbi:CHRD domain-containing protein [soil metagenome]